VAVLSEEGRRRTASAPKVKNQSATKVKKGAEKDSCEICREEEACFACRAEEVSIQR
jgi:hypothetical protein